MPLPTATGALLRTSTMLPRNLKAPSRLFILFPHKWGPTNPPVWHAFHNGESTRFFRILSNLGKNLTAIDAEALDLNRLLVSTHLWYQSEQLSPLEQARSQGDSRLADM